MNKAVAGGWEESTKEATRCVFEEMAFYSADMRVHLKHIHGHFGSIPLEKALRGELQIELKNDMGLMFYPDVEAMINAGWVVD